jgi:hypothetical protein
MSDGVKGALARRTVWSAQRTLSLIPSFPGVQRVA